MMSKIIEEYYKSANLILPLIKQKMEKLERNTDILKEFEYWVENKSYKDQGAIVVNGYTAKQIADLSKFLDGEGAFMLLIELRENPKKALMRIAEGFKMK